MAREEVADVGPWDVDPPPPTARFRCTGPREHVVWVAAYSGDPCPERDGDSPCPGKLKDW